MSIQSLRTLFCSLLILYVCSVSAQFNIKVGYSGNYTNLETTNEIFDRYNSDFISVEQKLKPINFYHGIEIGGRYKFGENFGIDFGVSSTSGKNDVKGVLTAEDEVNNRVKITLSSYYVGLENYFGSYGYGATIGSQKIKYKVKPSRSSENIDLLDQRVLNSRFYLIFELPSNQTAFSFRPFVSINWDSYNIQKLETSLLPNGANPSSDLNEDLMVFGVSLLIYNGRQ